MHKTLNLRKLKTSLDIDDNSIYYLEDIYLNEFIGKKFSINYTGGINCIGCGTKTKKSYSQGFCFICMRSLAECDICIIKPELCHFSKGTCRDVSWGEQNCMQTHIVYLANTGNIKVGITKLKNIPSRWIDQGASQATSIFAVKSRLVSGLVEVALKEHISDKTNWRKMLNGEPSKVDLVSLRDELFEKSYQKVLEIKTKHGNDSIKPVEQSVKNINYPVVEYPSKIRTFNLDKTPNIQAKLVGVKAQYMIFDTGVINIRKFSGYRCDISAC